MPDEAATQAYCERLASENEGLKATARLLREQARPAAHRRAGPAAASGREPPGAQLPPALALAGGPRAGLGGIADALALLPELSAPKPRR